MTLIFSSVVLEALSSEFDKYVYLPVIDTYGSILLEWKSRDMTITNLAFTKTTLSTQVSTP